MRHGSVAALSACLKESPSCLTTEQYGRKLRQALLSSLAADMASELPVPWAMSAVQFSSVHFGRGFIFFFTACR